MNEQLIKDIRTNVEITVAVYDADITKAKVRLDPKPGHKTRGAALIREMVAGKHPEETRALKAEALKEYRIKREAEAAEHARIKVLEDIPGVREIRDNIEALEAWDAEFARQMDSEDGVMSMPRHPGDHTEELKKAYPDAAAYIKACAWRCAAHYVKSSAGERAIKRMAEGVKPTEAVADMEREWNEYIDAHMWD